MSYNSGVIGLVNYLPDYSLNCTPLSPITITNNNNNNNNKNKNNKNKNKNKNMNKNNNYKLYLYRAISIYSIALYRIH